jgi:hypothetical protein
MESGTKRLGDGSYFSSSMAEIGNHKQKHEKADYYKSILCDPDSTPFQRKFASSRLQTIHQPFDTI